MKYSERKQAVYITDMEYVVLVEVRVGLELGFGLGSSIKYYDNFIPCKTK